MARRALLGGSFDPIHLGHLELARIAHEVFGFEHIELLPAGQPWQKSHMTPVEHRIHMIELAIKPYPFISINLLETQNKIPTYTIETLKTLQAQHPQDEFYFIMGADQLKNFCTWKDWNLIPQYATLIVFSRQEHETPIPIALLECLKTLKKPIIRIEIPLIPISSSWIRSCFITNNTQEITPFLPSEILEYITSHHLYS